MKNYQRNIFVFGSNEGGKHGAGAARFAMEKYGAEWGVGVGMTGETYALPTKTADFETLPLPKIDSYIKDFLVFAGLHPQWLFHLTPVGCGLANLNIKQIGAMLKRHGVPTNVVLTKEWVTDHF